MLPSSSLSKNTTCVQDYPSEMGRSKDKSYNTIDLQQLSMLSGGYPMEQADWIQVNEKLRSRGLTPIKLAQLEDTLLKTEGYNLFDEEASGLLRKTILHLLQENEKKQKLIQGFQDTTSLKNTASSPIKDFDENQDNKLINDQNNKWDIQMMSSKQHTKQTKEQKFKSLDLQQEYNKRIDHLQSELGDLRDALQHLKLESKVKESKKDTKKEENGGIVETFRSTQDTIPSSAKFRMDYFENETPTIRRYKKKCASLKSKIHLLKLENSQLHTNIQSLESSLKKKRSSKDERSYSPSHQKLKDIYEAFSARSQKQCLAKLRDIQKQHFYLEELEKLLERIAKIVIGDELSSVKVLEDRMEVFTTLMMWRSDRDLLKDLVSIVENLKDLLLPSQSGSEGQSSDVKPSIHDIITCLRKIVNCVKRGHHLQHVGDDNHTYSELRNIVRYFMKLFDVDKESAVYTRVYDVYMRYHEMANVLKSLREILHLNEHTGLNDIVETVGELRKSKEGVLNLDLKSVMKQVEEYDRFYDAFRQLIKDLMKVLSVSKLDEILPAVKTLKK